MAILCMESGGTKLVAALATEQGELTFMRKEFRRADQLAEETLEQLIRMGRQLQGEHRVQAVGFGFGGIVPRRHAHPLICFHESGWESVKGRERLEKAFQVPVFIENDCNLAALGEVHCGVCHPQGTFFYVTLGTGVGGGIVQDGRLVEFGSFGEGEIGHCVLEEDGPRCACGNRGCLETFCSGPGLARLAKRMGVSADPESLMANYRQGEKTAGRVVEQAAAYLGRALGSAINLLHPDMICLGGGLMRSNEPFLELISQHCEPFVFPVFRGKTRFVSSRLGERAVCQGAAVYACQQLGLGFQT